MSHLLEMKGLDELESANPSILVLTAATKRKNRVAYIRERNKSLRMQPTRIQ